MKIRYASEVEARIPADSAVAACLCGDSPAAQIAADCPEALCLACSAPEALCLACSAEEQDDCLVAKAGCQAERIAADLEDASVLPAWFAESPDV